VLRWSARARADLKAIHDYIAKDSPTNAKTVVHEILARAATLPETPRIGRRVPELDDPDIREVPVHSWRVIYQLRGETVFIVTLVHRRRAPAPEQLRR
jgi:addiction module RelE/StbE family toxin